MFQGAIKKIIVPCFYGPRYIEGNTVFQVHLPAAKKEYLIAVLFKQGLKSCKEFF